ncbi:mitochondrial FAD-linked sulfhydryl oxidase Erv1p [Monosporozyma servazzii]
MTQLPPEKSSSPTTGLTGRKIIYDKDGKPCRSCNTLLDFQFATGKIDPKAAKISLKTTPNKSKFISGALTGLIPGSRTYRKIQPPTKEQVGHDSWMLLHSVVASYQEEPNDVERKEMTRFIELFGKVYPVKEHGEDLTNYIKSKPIDATNRNTLGLWLNQYHNTINSHLGKEAFDSKFWEDRWVNGWE